MLNCMEAARAYSIVGGETGGGVPPNRTANVRAASTLASLVVLVVPYHAYEPTSPRLPAQDVRKPRDETPGCLRHERSTPHLSSLTSTRDCLPRRLCDIGLVHVAHLTQALQ